MNQILTNGPAISKPNGFCFPSRSVARFTARYFVAAFIDVAWENKISFSGDCDNTPPDIVTNGNYSVPAGNLSFTFRFERVGNDYMCVNRGDFNTAWQGFIARVNAKVQEHTLNETEEWPNGSCTKMVQEVDKCGRAKMVPKSNPLTRNFTRKKTPSVRNQQSISSSQASCNIGG